MKCRKFCANHEKMRPELGVTKIVYLTFKTGFGTDQNTKITYLFPMKNTHLSTSWIMGIFCFVTPIIIKMESLLS